MKQFTAPPSELSNATRVILSRKLGMPFEEIIDMTAYEADDLVYAKTGRKPVYSKVRDPRRTGKGNPLLSRRRIRTFADLEAKKDVFKWLSKF
jgi:hypothetical protein